MTYPGLMAKVKALNSKIITKDELDKLLSANDLSEITKQLKENPKLALSREKEIENMHRRDIEILLRTKMIDDFYNLFFYLPQEGKKFFKFMERRFEIENIKYVVRVFQGGKRSIDASKLFPLQHPSFRAKDLANANDLDDVLKLLKETPYYTAIDSAYKNYIKTKRIEVLLNALDLWYFTKMKNILKSLPNYGGGLRKIFYMQIDLTNIEWIYRAKILFNLETHEALNYIIPIEGRLNKDDFSKLASSNDVDTFLDNLYSLPYGKYFKNADKKHLSYIFQRISYRILYDYSKSLLAHTDNGLDVLGGYLYVREYEYMDIVSIIESKRYSIPKDKAQNYLILGGK